MPIELYFLKDRVAELSAQGRVTCDEASQVLRVLVGDARFTAGLKLLVDLRQMSEFTLDSPELRKLALEGKNHLETLKTARVAVLAPESYVFAMLRLYEQLAKQLTLEFQVCSDLAAAREWLAAR